MASRSIITGIDIGTSAIKGLCAVKNPGSLNLEILAQASQPSFGVRKGVVIDVEEISKNIRRLLGQLEQESGEKIDEVCININGGHLFSAVSRGSIIVSRADQKISEEDVERVIQASRAIPLSLNNEILDVSLKEFILDGRGGIKDVVNMQGTKLEAEVLVIGVFSPYFRNLTKAVLGADLHNIIDVVPSPLASARAVLNREEKEIGVVLLDIGAGTTGLAVFREGVPIFVTVIPVGSANLTHDIAAGLRTNTYMAEKIKKEYGLCVLTGAERRGKRKIELPQSTLNNHLLEESPAEEEPSTIVFSQKMLLGIIEPRVSEMFALVSKELKKISNRQSFPAGVVLTGGGSMLPRLTEIAKRELNLPVHLGIPRIYSAPPEDSGEPDELRLLGAGKDSSWGAVCGLVLSGGEIIEEETSPSIIDKLKKFLKQFIP